MGFRPVSALAPAVAPALPLWYWPTDMVVLLVRVSLTSFTAPKVMFFAFTSIIGNYAYAESAMTFLKMGGSFPIMLLRIAVLLMVIWGAYESVATVFNTADAAMGLMATVNLIAIVMLSGLVVKLTRDYFAQQKVGEPRPSVPPG